MTTFIACTLLLFASIILLIGYFTIRQILFCIRFGAASKAWPTADGIIIHSFMSEAPTPKHQNECKQAIEYEYEVDGKHYQCDRLSFNQPALLRTVAMPIEKRFMGYAVGTRISVYYDPADPLNATLVPGYRAAGITSNLLTGTASIVGGSILLILGAGTF